MPKRPQRGQQSTAAPIIRSGTAALLRIDPEREARKRKEQDHLLFRLDIIEARYLNKKLRVLCAEVWRRIAQPDFNSNWTEENLRDFTILNNVHDLDDEIPRARESIKAGDIWNNRHFARVHELDEALLFLTRLRELQDLRKRADTAATKRKALGQRTHERVQAMALAFQKQFPDKKGAYIRRLIYNKLKDTPQKLTPRTIRDHYPSQI
jgi:hypothetical protein